MSDFHINLQCECYHRRGVLSALRGRPCRRCRRMMSRNVVVVPTQIGVVAATTTVVPVVVSTY